MQLGQTFKVTILLSVLLLVAGCVATGNDISTANAKITEKFANMQTLYYDVSVTQSITQNTVEGTQTTAYSNVFYLKKPDKSKLIITGSNSSSGGSICNGTKMYTLYPTTQTFKVTDYSAKPCVNLNPEESGWLIPLEWGNTEKYSTVITEETLDGKLVWRAQVNQLNPDVSGTSDNGGSSQKSYILWFDKDTFSLLKMNTKLVDISHKSGVSYETTYADELVYSKFIIDDAIDDSIFYPPTGYTQSNGNELNPNDSNELNPNDSNQWYPSDSNELNPNDSNEWNPNDNNGWNPNDSNELNQDDSNEWNPDDNNELNDNNALP